MPHLSICMPSNRPFATSRRAIETALAYCEARDALLIVADNSGDAEKRAYWQGRSGRLTYLIDPARSPMENFLAAIHAAKTPFLMPMGDDDEIAFDPALPGFDFEALPADHIGVRPITHVWTQDRGVTRIKEYAITAENPADRIIEYNNAAGGDNSAFYSAFRRDPYINLMELFARHHPTKGAYCDWSEVSALFSYGKLALDRGTVYRYNFDGWHQQSLLDGKTADAYVAAGLPVDTEKYSTLLRYLDMFVFVSSRQSPLPQEELSTARLLLSGAILNGFLNQVLEQPGQYGATMQYLAETAAAAADPFERFQIALVMADQIRDGLKNRYVAYFRAAIAFENVASACP